MRKLPSYLWRNRHGTFYFRIVIPTTIRDRVSVRGREFRRSLRTDSWAVAVRRVRPYIARTTEIFEEAEQGTAMKFRLIDFLDVEIGKLKVGRVRIDQKSPEQERQSMKEAAETLVAVADAFAERAESDNDHIDEANLGDVVEAFCGEQERLGKWTEKTAHENRAIYALFRRIIGDKPFASLKHPELRAYKEVMLQLPANINKRKQFRDKTIDEILAMDDVEPIRPNTINKNFVRISSLFKWAKRHGYTDENYGEGLTIGKDRRARDERKTFTQDDLKRLFESSEYKKGFQHSFQYWTPLIGLYSAMRIEEICQLHLDDIRQEDGVWVFDINEDGEKKLKSDAGKRLVPIHPELIQLGLLDEAERLRALGKTRLFPELTRQRDGYSQRVSKWFARYASRCGVTDPGKVFHSFRHTAIDALKQAEVPHHQVAAIAGHHEAGMTFGRYGDDFKPHVLREKIGKIQFGLNHQSSQSTTGSEKPTTQRHSIL